jgi:hypothetical protein
VQSDDLEAVLDVLDQRTGDPGSVLDGEALLEAAPHTIRLDRIGAEEIGALIVLLDRVDAALSDGRVENRKGQVRSLIDLRNRLSGRLERWRPTRPGPRGPRTGWRWASAAATRRQRRTSRRPARRSRKSAPSASGRGRSWAPPEAAVRSVEAQDNSAAGGTARTRPAMRPSLARRNRRASDLTADAPARGRCGSKPESGQACRSSASPVPNVAGSNSVAPISHPHCRAMQPRADRGVASHLDASSRTQTWTRRGTGEHRQRGHGRFGGARGRLVYPDRESFGPPDPRV